MVQGQRGAACSTLSRAWCELPPTPCVEVVLVAGDDPGQAVDGLPEEARGDGGVAGVAGVAGALGVGGR